jgi:hypothetical protein
MLPYPDSHEEAEKMKRDFRRKQRTEIMHRLYGECVGRTCGECDHFLVKVYSKAYYKCLLFGNTGGSATDWGRKWPACGKFKEREREG